MGTYKCKQHGMQGFTIVCTHVCDAVEERREMATDTVPPVAGYRFVRCEPCRDQGVVYDPEQSADLVCSECFKAWAG